MIVALAILAALAGLALVGFFWWAGRGTLPTSAKHELSIDQAGPPPVTIAPGCYTMVTYNLGYLSGLANNRPVWREPTEFAAHLAQVRSAWQTLSPDLISYQEIDYGAARSFGVDQSAALAEGCYAFRADAVNWDKRYVPFPYWPPKVHFGRVLSGQSLHSRFPVRLLEHVVLPMPPERPFLYRRFYTDRLAQVCAVQLPEGEIVVINLHLEAYIASARIAQIKVVEQLYLTYRSLAPVIIAGDFNIAASVPTTDAPDLLGQLLLWPGLACAISPGEWGMAQHLTFPSNAPIEQIDFIFYDSARLTNHASGISQLAGTASDHCPVWLQFSFR